MERLDRMFMEAAARAAAASTRAPAGGDAEGEDEAEADLSAADHILRACAKGDVFAALALPAPACDDAGRPVWDVTDKEMSKAFRKRSLAVHPDKNPAPEAKRAFDKLNDAIRVLRDPVTRGEALRKFAEEAFKKRCRLHPELTAAAKREQAKRDASEYGDEIVRQQREHRERQLAGGRLGRVRRRGISRARARGQARGERRERQRSGAEVHLVERASVGGVLSLVDRRTLPSFSSHPSFSPLSRRRANRLFTQTVPGGRADGGRFAPSRSALASVTRWI